MYANASRLCRLKKHHCGSGFQHQKIDPRDPSFEFTNNRMDRLKHKKQIEPNNKVWLESMRRNRFS